MLPFWVEKFKKPGYRIQVRNGKYYYFRVKSSKKIEGKKNPQPIQEYLGRITEEGLISSRYRCNSSTYEYGFSVLCLMLGKEIFKDATPNVIVSSILSLNCCIANDVDLMRVYELSVLYLLFPGLELTMSISNKEINGCGKKLISTFNKCNIPLNEARIALSRLEVVSYSNQRFLTNVKDYMLEYLRMYEVNEEEFFEWLKKIPK